MSFVILESPCEYIVSLQWLNGMLVGGAFHETVQMCCQINKSSNETTSQTSRKLSKFYTIHFL